MSLQNESEQMEKLKQVIEKSKKIVFFGGAGVSTESGIPDFRSEKGLYSAVEQYGHSPEEMLSHSFFQHHMDTFFEYYKKNLIYQEAIPNAAHIALAKLEKQGKLLGIVTQNIDGLHQIAGSKNVFELHGSVLRNYCQSCGKFYDVNEVLQQEGIPKCSCLGIIKPHVVLYEEPLDSDVMEGAVHIISKADTLIVGGTSLVVYPAAGLINYFRGNHLILINKSQTPYDNKADIVIHRSLGDVFGEIVE